MRTLTESEIQAEYIDDAFADGNADQALLARIERGLAYQRWLRERDRVGQRTISWTRGGADGDAA